MVERLSVGQRLLELRNELGHSQVAMAKLLGIANATWQKIERDEGLPSGETLMQFEKLGINPGWIISGLGPKNLDEQETQAAIVVDQGLAQQLKTAIEQMAKVAQDLTNQVQPRELVVEHYEPKTVKYYPTIHASAGGGLAALVESPGYDLDVEGLARVLFGVEQRDLFFLPVRGDSMLPTFAHGDIAVIERWRGVSEIEDNRIYVVSLDGDIYVKRAMWELDGLKWLSDNELPQYEPILVPKDRINDMNVLGEVLWRLQPIRKKKA